MIWLFLYVVFGVVTFVVVSYLVAVYSKHEWPNIWDPNKPLDTDEYAIIGLCSVTWPIVWVVYASYLFFGLITSGSYTRWLARKVKDK